MLPLHQPKIHPMPFFAVQIPPFPYTFPSRLFSFNASPRLASSRLAYPRLVDPHLALLLSHLLLPASLCSRVSPRPTRARLLHEPHWYFMDRAPPHITAVLPLASVLSLLFVPISCPKRIPGAEPRPLFCLPSICSTVAPLSVRLSDSQQAALGANRLSWLKVWFLNCFFCRPVVPVDVRRSVARLKETIRDEM